MKVQAINRHRFTVDGKGITTLVGLYGCPLRCRYCINKDILSTARYREMSPGELAKELMIDYCYFLATGGGVTLGGGESLLYAGEIRELKELLPDKVNVNVETSLNVDRCNLECVLDSVDHMIIDVKTLNSAVYECYTGVSPQKTVENLRYLSERKLQRKCTVRIPEIPGFTSEADIAQTREEIMQLGFEDIDAFKYVVRDSAVGRG
ncbi:MAG: radical SAM protein [Acetatifactor sp.]|nr:radical SAM protein [Acetatifactor sp.]